MNFSGSYLFTNLDATHVWSALLDPSLLKMALPQPVHQMRGLIYQRQGTLTFTAHVGPFAERLFTLQLAFEGCDPPQMYTAVFSLTDETQTHKLEGHGQWRLTPHGRDTIVSYDMDITSHGEFATVGPLLVQTHLRHGVRHTLHSLEKWLGQAATQAPFPLR